MGWGCGDESLLELFNPCVGSLGCADEIKLQATSEITILIGLLELKTEVNGQSQVDSMEGKASLIKFWVLKFTVI